MQPVQANKAHRHRRSSRRPREVSRFLNARAKSWPEGATKTRQYDLLRSRVGQKEPPRLGSTICYGQELARKSHRDSAVRFVTAKRGPERATKTRQYDLLRPNMGQKEPPRLGSTLCYGQELSRKSHQDSAVRFVTSKSWPERATKTRQYDLLRPNVGQKEPPKLGSTICYGQELARKSHQDSAVRFVTAKRGPERATKTRQYDLLRPRVGQKEPPRLGSTICYGQTWARKSHQNSAVRFVTAKSWSERATKTRQYDLLRPNVGQKDSARPPPPHTQPICRAYPQPTLKVGNSWARREIRGQGREIRGQGRKFVGKAGKFVGKVGKFVGKVGIRGQGRKTGREIRAQGREIRGQGRKFVGKVGKFVGKVGNSWARSGNSWARSKTVGNSWARSGNSWARSGNSWARSGPNLAHQFPGPRDLAHEFPDFAHEFPTLPTNFPTLPTCPRISRPCPRISRLAHEFH